MSEDMLNVMGSFISTELDAFENLHKELEEKDKEIERLNSIIETTKIFVEKYNDKLFDIELRKMILKCLNDELKGSD